MTENQTNEIEAMSDNLRKALEACVKAGLVIEYHECQSVETTSPGKFIGCLPRCFVIVAGATKEQVEKTWDEMYAGFTNSSPVIW